MNTELHLIRAECDISRIIIPSVLVYPKNVDLQLQENAACE